MEGYIYKINCGDEIYIGSTKQKLKIRQNEHNSKLRTNFNSSFYQGLLKQNITQVELILLEKCIVENREELYKKEQEYIDRYSPKINKIRVRTDRKKYLEELKIKNKDRTKEYKKEYNPKYYEKNKERLLTKYTCVCGKTLNYCGKSAHEKTKKHIYYMNNI